MAYEDVAEDESERQFLRQAEGESLDADIALVRLVIKRLVTESHSVDALKGMSVLSQLLKARRDLQGDKNAPGEVSAEVEKILKDLGL